MLNLIDTEIDFDVDMYRYGFSFVSTRCKAELAYSHNRCGIELRIESMLDANMRRSSVSIYNEA